MNDELFNEFDEWSFFLDEKLCVKVEILDNRGKISIFEPEKQN